MTLQGKEISEQEQLVRAEIPNAKTLAAMEELESGKGKRVATIAELMAELNAEN
jgi:hypothetical protein